MVRAGGTREYSDGFLSPLSTRTRVPSCQDSWVLLLFVHKDLSNAVPGGVRLPVPQQCVEAESPQRWLQHFPASFGAPCTLTLSSWQRPHKMFVCVCADKHSEGTRCVGPLPLSPSPGLELTAVSSARGHHAANP